MSTEGNMLCVCVCVNVCACLCVCALVRARLCVRGSRKGINNAFKKGTIESRTDHSDICCHALKLSSYDSV
jgi:hypothetical protein